MPEAGGPAARGPAAVPRLVSALLPSDSPLRRTRAYYLLSHLVQRAVDAPVALERLRGALRAAWPFRVPPRAGGRPDLGAEVTVFVTTVGRSTLPATLAALDAQDCSFSGPQVIRHVAPWPRAFRAMVERCQTPYFVQVDEDMVLRPEAVRTLHAAIAAGPPDLALVCHPLWDPRLGQCIQGVKVWRREALVPYAYREGTAPSIDLVSRLRADGHRLRYVTAHDYLGREVRDDPHRPEVLGEHRVEGLELVFERSLTLFAGFLQFPSMRGTERFLGELLDRLDLGRPDDPDLWALLGAVAGLVDPARARDHYAAGARHPALRWLEALVRRGPEEVGLWLSGAAEAPAGRGAPGAGAGRPDAAPSELERLRWLYRTIRRVRLLGPGDPLRAPGFAELARAVARRDLELLIESPGEGLAEEGVLAALAAHAERTRLTLVVDGRGDPPGAGWWAAVEQARARGLRVALRATLRRGALLDPGRAAALRDLLARGLACCDEVELAHALPRTPPPRGAAGEGGPPAPGPSDADPVHADDAEAVARLADLGRGLEGVRLPRPLPRARGPGRCTSPFEGLVVDGAGALSGCLAGLIPPSEEHWSIYRGAAEELWFERHLADLRDELSGKRTPRWPCSACPHNA